MDFSKKSVLKGRHLKNELQVNLVSGNVVKWHSPYWGTSFPWASVICFPPRCAVHLSSSCYPKEGHECPEENGIVDGPSSCRKREVKAWPSCSGATTPEQGELAHHHFVQVL